MAVAAARRRNTRMVIGAALASASPKDLQFLRAMADDARNTVGNYRVRLINAGLIEPAGASSTLPSRA